LYQDRIATIQPLGGITDWMIGRYPPRIADTLRASRQQHEILGDLHQSISLSDLSVDDETAIDLQVMASRWRRVGSSGRVSEALTRWSALGPKGSSGYKQLAGRLRDHFLSGRPVPGWDFILASKLSWHIVEHLLHEVGFVEFRDGGLAVLLAPTELVQHTMAILATAQCEQLRWVPMGPENSPNVGAWRDYTLDDDELIDQTVATFLMQVPAPPPDIPLDAVVAFRRQHEDELSAARSALRSMAEAARTHSNPQEVREELQRILSDALREVDAALAAHRRRRLVRLSMLVRSPEALLTGAAAAGAGYVEDVVAGAFDSGELGLTQILTNPLSPAALGTAAGAFGISAGSAWLLAHRARRRIDQLGLGYLYEVQRRFPSPRSPLEQSR
jgi:hypothetical protein